MDCFNFIDLFCGIGGFHLALKELGGNCVFACDIDDNCRQTYYDNYGLMPKGDIKHINAEDIPRHDFLCAGFPCQSFSKAGKRLGFDDPTRGTLFFDILRIAEYHKPRYILLENVRNLASHDKGNTWHIIHAKLYELGYNVIPSPVIFSPHYLGIPQHRERVYIMCIRKDIGALPDFYFNLKNIRKCSIDDILLSDHEIDNIEKYKLDKEEIELIDLWNEFIQNINGRLPGFPIWSHRLKELDDSEDLTQYPKWHQNFIHKNHQLYINNKSFIDSWLNKASKCKKFFGAKAKMEWQAGQTSSPDIWQTIMQFRPSGLRVKDATYFPALVAITQTSIIGQKKRYLTPRECARMQSFPDSFIINDKDSVAYKQFGNAVNVECAKLFAAFLLNISNIQNTYSYHNQFGDKFLSPNLFSNC